MQGERKSSNSCSFEANASVKTYTSSLLHMCYDLFPYLTGQHYTPPPGVVSPPYNAIPPQQPGYYQPNYQQPAPVSYQQYPQYPPPNLGYQQPQPGYYQNQQLQPQPTNPPKKSYNQPKSPNAHYTTHGRPAISVTEASGATRTNADTSNQGAQPSVPKHSQSKMSA